MEGRSALVTGAANGIGLAIARQLAADGLRVAAADIEQAPPGDGVYPYWLDVTDLDSHDPLLDRVEADIGPLAVLVNVAGVAIPEPLGRLTVSAYRRQHAVLLDGPVWLARQAGLRMARTGGGRIVNISSVHASNAEPGSLAYDSAKAGLEAATRSLAVELAPQGVLVNSVAPGFVRTRMSVVDGADELESDWFRDIYLARGKLPLGRPAEPAEIATVVSYLVSPANTYVTGQRVVADGGLTATF